MEEVGKVEGRRAEGGEGEKKWKGEGEEGGGWGGGGGGEFWGGRRGNFPKNFVGPPSRCIVLAVFGLGESSTTLRLPRLTANK